MSFLLTITRDLALQTRMSPFQILSDNNQRPYLILSKGFVCEAAKKEHYVNIPFELYVQTAFLLTKLLVKIKKLKYFIWNDYIVSKVRVSHRIKSMLIVKYLTYTFGIIASCFSLDLIKRLSDFNKVNKDFVMSSFESSLNIFNIDNIKCLFCADTFVFQPIYSRYDKRENIIDINVLIFVRLLEFFSAFLNNIKRLEGPQ